MKKIALTLLLGFVFNTSVAHSLSTEDFTSTQTLNNWEDAVQAEEKGSPFAFEVSYDAVGKGEFTRRGLRHEGVKFGEFEADLCSVIYYNECAKEGANICLSYNNTWIYWAGNPFFKQSHFNTATVALGLSSERLRCWHWQARVAMNVDTDHFDIDDYATYDMFLWGRYAYWDCPTIGIHVGLIAQTGMKIDHVYPILGFDWQIKRCWKLNAVIPVNVSLVYTLDDAWSVAIAGRFFDSRHRVGKHEPIPKGIIEYRALGAELAVNYQCTKWLTLNLHAGSTLGGKLKTSNRHHDDRRHFKFEGAPYAGGELGIHF